MEVIIVGTILLSLLHAIIPTHWLPILTVGQSLRWNITQVSRMTFVAASAHVISTISLGIILSKIGWHFSEQYKWFTPYIAPVILIVMGILIIGIDFHRLHFRHNPEKAALKTKSGMILGLVTVMFFSPCLEIEGYFLVAGGQGWRMIVILSALYGVITVICMVIWVRLMFRGLLRMNWEKLEFNSGIITGMILVATGMIILII
ncbi:MAG TPA: hypothetical protein VGD22_08415 [Sphingobacteriaceae bacterium]